MDNMNGLNPTPTSTSTEEDSYDKTSTPTKERSVGQNGQHSSPSPNSKNKESDLDDSFATGEENSGDATPPGEEEVQEEHDPEWKPVELRALKEQVRKQQQKRRLKTPYGYANVTDIRENEDGSTTILVDFPFGKGFLNPQTIGSPSRFSKGDKVQTPYGKGLVQSLRLTDDTKIYKVKLNEWYMANDVHPRAFLTHTDVKGRVAITFDEGIREAGVLKEQGNAKFKAKQFEEATQHYARAIQTVQMAPMNNLRESQKNSLRQILITCFSNRAQACLQMSPPRHEDALQACNLALQIDSSDKIGSKSKLLFRRAKALHGLRQYKEALQDLKHESLASQKTARELRQRVAADLKKENQKGKKMWGAAFEKAAKESSEEEQKPRNGDSQSNASAPSSNPLARSSSPDWKNVVQSQQASDTQQQQKEEVSWPGDDMEDADNNEQLECLKEEDEESSSLFSNKWLWGTVALGGIATAAYIWNRRRK